MNTKIDKITFTSALAVVLFVCLPLGFMPDQAGPFVSGLYNEITENLGILYQLAAIGTIVFLTWLAFGRYGHVRFGDQSSKPEFSTFSWVAMLFCAGVGAGLIYWAGIEWGYYYDAPPFGVEPQSVLAAEYAAAYGLFHWGIVAWAIYCLPTIAIAYPYYNRKIPYLRLSTACHEFLGKNGQASLRGRLMDIAFMVALLGGAGTSLGLTTPMIASSLSSLVGIQSSFAIEATVVVLCVLLFGVSVYFGLEKGIKRLSDLNAILAFVFLGFILVAGPTLFIMRMSLDSLGLMFDDMIRMLTWTDPITRSRFVEDWTVFYWAWWIAYAPFVGLFVTRISKGRTIKQVIISMLLFGSMGGWAFYMVFGNYAMYLDINNIVPVTQIMADVNPAEAITAIVTSLPFTVILLTVFITVSVIFVATTYDSASYTLAAVATKELKSGDHPTKSHRLFWALVIGILPILLMFIGELKVVQSATLVASLPLLFIGIIMSMSLVRSLKTDHG